MSNHQHHNHCAHDLKYCGHCDVVYCATCDKHWRTYSNSNGWSWIANGTNLTTLDTNVSTGTVGSNVSPESHDH